MPDGAHRSGFVALAGAPNAGKSTLLNRLLGQKVAAVSPRPQTTRNRILGVLTGEGFQIALLDTPGIHRPRPGLARAMVETALGALREGDVAALVVDATRRGVEEEDEALSAVLAARGRKRALLLNKIDRARRPALLPLIDAFRARGHFDLVYPLSALTGENAEGLAPALAALLPEGPELFPPETLTDQDERKIVAELIREQVFRQTGEEIPYGVAVEIEQFDEGRREGPRPLVRIQATLHAVRTSHKGILIGKGGQKLKAIGTAARREIERLLGCPVFLGLNVRVEEGWTVSDAAIRRFGYAGAGRGGRGSRPPRSGDRGGRAG